MCWGVDSGHVFMYVMDLKVWDELLSYSLNFLTIMKQVFNVWELCCLTSICACVTPPSSLLSSLSICPLYRLSTTRLCLPLPLWLSVAVGSLMLASLRLPLTSRLTDWSSHCLSDATMTVPFWTLSVCRHVLRTFFFLSYHIAYVAGAADKPLTVAIVFTENKPLCWFY